jgi:hypothetical protein
MKNESREVSHDRIPPEDREFYIEGAILTALSAVIAVVAAL